MNDKCEKPTQNIIKVHESEIDGRKQGLGLWICGGILRRNGVNYIEKQRELWQALTCFCIKWSQSDSE